MLLEAREVTKAFGNFKAVDAASVTLDQGDILGLIGPNGAGKSTLFNCLTGDLLSTSGQVLFEGHDITALAPEARAELGLARTFQVPQTFEGMSVLENVMIGAFLRTSRKSEAETARVPYWSASAWEALQMRQPVRWERRAASGWKLRARSRPSPKSFCSTKQWRA